MTDISSARRSLDSRALTGDSYWPSLPTYNMHSLNASCGDRKPLLLLCRKNLYNAPVYAFVVPSSSFRHTAASYELPISRSVSSGKARNAFLTPTARLSRSLVPRLANDPPPPRDPWVRWAASAASELGTLKRPMAVATKLAWSRGRVGAVLPDALVGAIVLAAVGPPELKILRASSPGL